MKKSLSSIIIVAVFLYCVAFLIGCTGLGGSGGSSDETLEVKYYTVTFVTNGGSEIQPLQFKKGNAPDVSRVGEPMKEGFTFFGWFTDSELTVQYFGNNYSAPKGDFILYAKYENSYKITLELNGGEGKEYIYIQKNLHTNEPVTFGELPVPQKNGYLFKGWFFEDNYSEAVNPLNTVNGDRTIYAKWAKLLSVSFNTNGGNEVAPVLVEESTIFPGDKVETPRKDNFVFDGWFTDPEFTVQPSVITEDTLLYAKWAKALTISFETNGGNVKPPMIIGEDQYILNLGEDPTKADSLFRGWFADAELTQKFASTTLQEDVTLFAKWIPADSIVLTARNFANYFNVTFRVKRTYVNMGIYYTYRHSIVYSVSLKDEAYAASQFSSDSIQIEFSFVFSKPGYASLYLNEKVTLLKEKNYSVADKESAEYQNFVEDGVSSGYSVINAAGDLYQILEQY